MPSNDAVPLWLKDAHDTLRLELRALAEYVELDPPGAERKYGISVGARPKGHSRNMFHDERETTIIMFFAKDKAKLGEAKSPIEKAITRHIRARGEKILSKKTADDCVCWSVAQTPSLININQYPLPLQFAVARSTDNSTMVVITNAATGGVAEVPENIYPDVSKMLCNLFTKRG